MKEDKMPGPVNHRGYSFVFFIFDVTDKFVSFVPEVFFYMKH
jgi:hypothetical protein